MRAFSELSLCMDPRFPVLRFLGICRAGESLWRHRASATCRVSSPIPGTGRPPGQHMSGALPHMRCLLGCREVVGGTCGGARDLTHHCLVSAA